MPRSRRPDLIHAAEESVARVTDSAGRWDLTAATTELAKRLRADPNLMDPDRVARDLIESLDRLRRPSPSQPTLGALFDKDAWLPLGSGLRVQMGRAQRDDLDAWLVVLTEEHEHATVAYSTKLRYITTRRQAWTPDDDDLTDVENRLGDP